MKTTRRDNLRAYVVDVIGELLTSGKIRLTDTPDKIIAAVWNHARTDLLADWKAVLAEVGGGVVGGLMNTAEKLAQKTLAQAFMELGRRAGGR